MLLIIILLRVRKLFIAPASASISCFVVYLERLTRAAHAAVLSGTSIFLHDCVCLLHAEPEDM